MRWQESTPGIERAKCVMRWRSNPYASPAVFIRAFKVDGGIVYPGNLWCPTCKRPPRTYFSERNQLRYPDDYPAARTISGERVERAVETQTFLDVCADEGLAVTRYGVGSGEKDEWQVQGPSYCGLVSQSLRGAYMNYHARLKEVRA